MTPQHEDYATLVHLAATDQLTDDLEKYRTNLMGQLGFDEATWKSDVAAERSRLRDEHSAKQNLPGQGTTKDPRPADASSNPLQEALDFQVRRHRAIADRVLGVRDRALKLSRGEPPPSEMDRLREGDRAWAKSLER